MLDKHQEIEKVTFTAKVPNAGITRDYENSWDSFHDEYRLSVHEWDVKIKTKPTEKLEKVTAIVGPVLAVQVLDALGLR